MGSVANDLQEIIADLRRKLEALAAERDDALAQQAAATEVLQVINSSTGNLTPAFDTIVEKAVRLCRADGGTLWLVKDGTAQAMGGRNVPTRVSRICHPRDRAGQIRIGPRWSTPPLHSHARSQGDEAVQGGRSFFRRHR